MAGIKLAVFPTNGNGQAMAGLVPPRKGLQGIKPIYRRRRGVMLIRKRTALARASCGAFRGIRMRGGPRICGCGWGTGGGPDERVVDREAAASGRNARGASER